MVPRWMGPDCGHDLELGTFPAGISPSWKIKFPPFLLLFPFGPVSLGFE